MLLVGGGRLVTRDPQRPFLEDGGVLCDGGLVREVGSTGDLRGRYPDVPFLDASGGVIHPGFINAHMHCYSALVRGFGGKGGEPASTFLEVLQRLWWRLDKALTLEDVNVSGLVCLVEAIRCGCTTLLDHHASPRAIPGSLFALGEAVRESGLSACLCYEVSDRDGEEAARQGIRENQEWIHHVARDRDPRLGATFGLHASLTLSDATLARCADAEGSVPWGFHVHVAEGPEDEAQCRREHGISVLERFSRFGLLGPQSLAIHCIHVDEREREILRETGTGVVHNPESNMGNAVGLAPVLGMLAQGIPVGLGTDGYVSDLLRSYALANALAKHGAGDPNAGWAEVPRMLFEHNGTLADRFFPVRRGRLTPGFAADLVVLDYDPPTPLTDRNVNGHLLFGPAAGRVRHTVASGEVLLEDRRLTRLDEREIAARARECALRVWERF